MARAYYEGYLGYQEAFSLKSADGTDHIIFVKINDKQFIELIQEDKKNWTNHGFMHDAAFETDNAEGMRAYLGAMGVKVPEKVVKDQVGDLSFDIVDPSGFTIQIVQYEPKEQDPGQQRQVDADRPDFDPHRPCRVARQRPGNDLEVLWRRLRV